MVTIESAPQSSIDHLEEPLDEAQNFEVRSCIVDGAQHHLRLDRFLTEIVPELSRSYLQKLLADGFVCLNGVKQAKASARVKVLDQVQVELRPTPDTLAFQPQDIPLDIVYEDEHLLVINKPAGLVVHPAPGNWSGTLLNGLLFHYPDAKSLPRAGIVHRLDKETSGLMLVGRTLHSCMALSEMIAARKVHREYVALAHGQWEAGFMHKVREIEGPIGRDPRSRIKMAVVAGAKPAQTDVFFLEGNAHYSLVRCILHTGRTHQIRVHLSMIGHPLVGDVLYGARPSCLLAGQALHACRISFLHPCYNQEMSFKQRWPEKFTEAVKMSGLFPVSECVQLF